jgi:glycerol-3-phosphate dehydrogenase (NAD(P)+)
MKMKIGILGAGAWATALGQVLADNGHHPLLWGVDANQVKDLNERHLNTQYFGTSVNVHPLVKGSTNLAEVLEGKKLILISVPSHVMREVLTKIAPLLKEPVIIINTTKGFDPATNKRMSELIREVIPQDKLKGVVSLIGPSHAEEVVVRHLTLITATSKKKSQAMKVAKLFSNKYFRVYFQKDEIGAEIGVAFKNAIAIASGIAEGLGLGDNARAALMTRGLKEMVRFGTFFGGKQKTYLGLTGLGDLAVTCYSVHSRNFKAGLQIGKDNSAEQFLKTNKTTVEGVKAAKTVYELASANQISIPLVTSVYRVLYEGKRPSDMLEAMMSRPLTTE